MHVRTKKSGAMELSRIKIADADNIKLASSQTTTERGVHITTTSGNAQSQVAASLWTVLETGVPTALASMTARTTRTGAAETMPLAQTRPSMAMDVRTLMRTSSAPRRAVPSLWTVWELGKSMAHAYMMMSHTRTRSAALILLREPLHIMASLVLMRIAMFSAAPSFARSLWTVLEVGTSLMLATMTRMHTRTSVADCTRSQSSLPTTDINACMPTSLRSAPLRSVPSLWTVLVPGAAMRPVTTLTLLMRMSAAACTM